MLEPPGTAAMSGGLKSPTTPRTKAFNTLSGKGKQPLRQAPTLRQGNQGLPLRHHISMGAETYQGPNDVSGQRHEEV